MTPADIAALGVIGAGGAGFPAHVKLDSRPDTVIVNAAECEPLLHKDMELLRHHLGQVLRGLEIVLEMTGAAEAIVGIKDRHREEIALLESRIPGRVRVMPLDDVYPAGDEVTLVYMTTRRIVQPGAIPLSVGCLVQNVETLYNIGVGRPVVDKFLSVAGAVTEPATVCVPVGVSFAEVLAQFEITAPRYVVRSGGLMMGLVEDDLSKPVSKRTGALIVLPEDHYCVTMYRRFATEHDTDRIAKAGCDQCSFCTEMCPRYLLGQPVRPETAMRNRMFTREEEPMIFTGNLSCCECNLCTMYACPEGLDPRGATVLEKRLAREQKLSWSGRPAEAHPMYDYRKVPSRKLRQRLDLGQFKDEGPMRELTLDLREVRIPLAEHIGAPARPVVRVGQTVRRGERIAEAVGKISANVHASIDGRVANVAEREIHLERVS